MSDGGVLKIPFASCQIIYISPASLLRQPSVMIGQHYLPQMRLLQPVHHDLPGWLLNQNLTVDVYQHSSAQNNL